MCSGILSALCDHVKEVSKLLGYDDKIPEFVELFMECRDDCVGVGGKGFVVFAFHVVYGYTICFTQATETNKRDF